MNSLVDTNIFLEILLNQNASQKCQSFLNDQAGASWMSDFSLHSLGVLLFRKGKADLFQRFVNDVLPQFSILTLQDERYGEVVAASRAYGLDFDDAYQLCVARESNLAIATRDRDFERVQNAWPVIFV